MHTAHWKAPITLSAIAAAIAASFCTLPAHADATPAGPEFQISQPLTGYTTPKVARNSSGTSVVVWEDNFSFPPQIYARIYNPDGTPKTDPLAVAPFTPSIFASNDQLLTAIDDDGDFIIAGTNQATVNGNFADYLAVQRYGADGTPQGSLIDVAPMLQGGATLGLHLAMDPDGDFVVGWTDLEQTQNWCFGFGYIRTCSYNEGSNTYARIYGKDGTPKTGALVVEQVPVQPILSINGKQKRYDLLTGLAMNASGQFAMGFSYTVTPSSYGAAAMLYDANGTPTSSKIILAKKAIGGADVGLDSQGNLVATWMTGFGLNANSLKLNFAGYSSAGTKLWQHSMAEPWTYAPQVKMQAGGDFVLGWESRPSTGGTQEMAQYFHANGSANGAAFMLTQNPGSDIGDPDIALDGNGNLFGAWVRALPDTGTGRNEVIMGRQFNAP